MARTTSILTNEEVIAVEYLAALDPNKAVVTDASGLVVSSSATDAEVGYLSGVTSSIQNQLNARGLLSGGNTWDGIQIFEDKVAIGENDTMTVNGSAINSMLAVHVDDGASLQNIEMHRHSNNAVGTVMYGAKSRGTGASPTAVQDDDALLSIYAVGHDGTDFATSGALHFYVDGTPGNNDMPGRFELQLSPDGSQTLATVFSVSSNAGALFTGNLTVDTNTLFVDASTNRVGIGTASPSVQYHQDFGSLGEYARWGDEPFTVGFRMSNPSTNIASGYNVLSMFANTTNSVAQGAIFITSIKSATEDTGTVAVQEYRAYRNASVTAEAVTTRPLFRWTNLTTSAMVIGADLSLTLGTTVGTGTGTLFASTLWGSTQNSNTSIIAMIDADNNSTSEVWAVRANGVATNLVSVDESGTIYGQQLIQLSNTLSYIGTNTVDGTDNKVMFLNSAGGGHSPTRGGFVYVVGNEFASEGGDVTLCAGDSAISGNINLYVHPGGYVKAMVIDRATGSTTLGTTPFTGTQALYSGDITIGASGQSVDRSLTITTQNSAYINLVADTDNVNEAHVAYMRLAQDGSTDNTTGVVGWSGFTGVANTLPDGTAFTSPTLTIVGNDYVLGTSTGSGGLSFVTSNASGLSGTVKYRISGTAHSWVSEDVYTYYTFIDSSFSGANMNMRRGRGTESTPAQLLSGDVIGGWYGNGYTDSGWGANYVGTLRLLCAENFTTTGQGTSWEFATTAIGATSRTVRMIIGNDGHLSLGATAGTATNYIYASRLQSSNANSYVSADTGTGNASVFSRASVFAVIDSDNNTTATAAFVVRADDSTNVFQVREDGLITATGAITGLTNITATGSATIGDTDADTHIFRGAFSLAYSSGSTTRLSMTNTGLIMIGASTVPVAGIQIETGNAGSGTPTDYALIKTSGAVASRGGLLISNQASVAGSANSLKITSTFNSSTSGTATIGWVDNNATETWVGSALPSMTLAYNAGSPFVRFNHPLQILAGQIITSTTANNFITPDNSGNMQLASRSSINNYIDYDNNTTATGLWNLIADNSTTIFSVREDGMFTVQYTCATSNVFTITGTSLTTGSSLRVYDNGADTSVRRVIFATNDNSLATGCIVAHLQQDSVADALFIDKNASGIAIDIDMDANDANACYGLVIDVENAGAGKEYAMRINGSSITSSAVGGSQDKKINVSIGGTDYYIPLYTA